MVGVTAAADYSGISLRRKGLFTSILTPPPVTPAANPSAVPETVCATALAAKAATAAEEEESFILLKTSAYAGAKGTMEIQVATSSSGSRGISV